MTGTKNKCGCLLVQVEFPRPDLLTRLLGIFTYTQTFYLTDLLQSWSGIYDSWLYCSVSFEWIFIYIPGLAYHSWLIYIKANVWTDYHMHIISLSWPFNPPCILFPVYPLIFLIWSIAISDVQVNITQEWMSDVLVDNMSTLSRVMAWWRSATSYLLNQCWPRSPTPFGVTRLEWHMISCWKHALASVHYLHIPISWYEH